LRVDVETKLDVDVDVKDVEEEVREME